MGFFRDKRLLRYYLNGGDGTHGSDGEEAKKQPGWDEADMEIGEGRDRVEWGEGDRQKKQPREAGGGGRE